MNKSISLIILFTLTLTVFGQNIDDSFSKIKMKKDLEIFREIRQKANSGLYKYRTEEQIDSIYN